MISEGQVGSLVHNSPPDRKSQGVSHINVIRTGIFPPFADGPV